MRPWSRTLSPSTPWAMALILALSSFAAIPMLGPFLFAFDDIHHLYRLWELDQLVRQGIVYSRWAPDLFFGYGSPVFHYNSPLAYYPGVLFHRLGLGYVDSLRLLFWLGLPLSGIAMYAWARQHLGWGASLFASLLYMYTPYHLLEVYLRGALPEYFAFVWFPLILLAARGVIAGGGRGWAPPLALGYAALILTHNLSAYLFLPALILYCAFLWPQRRRQGRSVLTSLAGALALAAGLSAFYALPALAERDLVLFARLLGNLPDHLFPWQTLVSTSLIHDYAITSAPEELRGIRLGLIQFLLLLAGAVVLLARGTPAVTRGPGAWALVMVGGGLFLMQPTARFFWEAVPLASLVQFPWRLLALLALAGALLGALGVQRLVAGLGPEERRISYLCLTAVVILSGLLGLDVVRTTLTEERVNRLGAWELELGYNLPGASAGREYVPVWVATEPTPPSADPVALLGQEPPSHYRAEPPDTWVELLEGHGNHFYYRVQAREPVNLTLNHAYFPGWVARVNGGEVPVEASAPEGLVSLSLPAGEHRLELRFGETPLRAAADMISFLSLGTTLFILIRSAPLPTAMRRPPSMPRARADGFVLLPAGGLAAGLVLLWMLGWWFASSGRLGSQTAEPGVFLQEVDHRLRIRGLHLAGSDLETEPLLRASAGSLLRATLGLTALPAASFASDESLFLCLVDRSHGRSDGHACAERPLEGLPEQEITVVLELEVPPRLPVGPYRLETGIDAAGASSRLPFTSQKIVPLLRSEPGRLARPLFIRQAPGPAAGPVLEGLAYADGTTLLSAEFPPTGVLYRRLMEELPDPPAAGTKPTRAGDRLAFDLVWRPVRSPATDYAVTARLRDSGGDVYAQAADLPLAAQEAGADSMRQELRLPIPYEVPPGDYVLEAALSWSGSVLLAVPPDAGGAAGGAGVWTPLQRVWVHPAFHLPGRPPQQLADARRLPITDALAMFDYRLPAGALRPGSRLDLDILWQATAAVARDLTARFELRDAGGLLLGEVAGPLGSSAYPTSRWRPGEVIRGQYHLPVAETAPGGPAALWASLIPEDGERPVAGLQLGSLQIQERPRRFDAPAITHRVGASLSGMGTLRGYNLEGVPDLAQPSRWPRGAQPAVTLVWEAERSTRAGYKVSLQLVSQAGAVAAQHDGVPDGGEAPTTTWAAGEIILDRHPMPLGSGILAGRYRLLVIVYQEASGQRLRFAGGGDALQLDEIIIS